MIESLNLVLVVFLVLANGFFVASEFALVGVRRSRIATMAEVGDKKAIRLLELVDNLNAYISATQLGITLSSLALGWIGEPESLVCLKYRLKGAFPKLSYILFLLPLPLPSLLFYTSCWVNSLPKLLPWNALKKQL